MSGDAAEKAAIETALAASGGNVSKAAALLKCGRRTLQGRMRLYGIQAAHRGREARHLAVPTTVRCTRCGGVLAMQCPGAPDGTACAAPDAKAAVP
jgi:hypothetical protein